MINKIKNQQGLGLVEVIAALGISVVVITSLLSLTLYSLRTSLNSTLLMEGTKAANRQMELIRAYRDSPATTWAVFTYNIGMCVGNTQCSINPTTVSLETHETTVSTGGTVIHTYFTSTYDSTNNVAHVTVTSTWSIGGQQKSTYVYTDFTNWQNK